jgi:YD repeat-containing protein
VISLFNSLKAQVNINIKHDGNKILQQDSLHANLYTTKKDLGDESKDEGATGDDEEIEIPGLPIFPSPKVTEMMKYTDFPTVDQYGGLPIQIPIYEINAKGLIHNIYLSYHSGGVTVGQEATWVGLGWNLQAGGSISRIVMDLPDDEVRNYSYTVPGGVNSHNVNVLEYGWLNNPDMIKNFPDIELGDDSYKDALYYNWNQQGESGNAGIAFGFLDFSNRLHQQVKHDCEPDIYYINVGNISAKFLFDFDGIPRLINPEQDLSIQYFKDDGSSDTRITSFIVKDNYGIEYHFGGSFNEETTVKTKTWGGCTDVLVGIWGSGLPDWELACFGEYIINTPYTSAWYLEKIVSPKGREINFYYTKPTNQMKIKIPVNKCQANNSLGLNNSWNKTISIEQEINTCYLDYIEFQDRVIKFEISARTDVENGYQLDRIKIKESIQSNDPIYQYDFDYYYMNHAGTYNEKRLILNKLTQNEQKEYLLHYYGGTFPAKDSYQQDFWGYYSTKSTGLIPKIFVYPQQGTGNQYRCYPISGQTGYTISGSDRTVDENNISTGVLRSITYPTRGKTIYEFEPNEHFDELHNGNIKGGGIRIAQIKKTDENDNILIEKSYEYNVNGHSSGVLIYDLAFATPSNYAPANNLTTYYYRWEQGSWSESKKHEYFTVRFTHNLYPPGNLDGYKIGYTNVEIIELGNGKTVMEYHPPQNYKSNSPYITTTPMNAWDFGWLDNSNYELIYPASSTTNNYTKVCYKDDDENYWLIYTSPFNPNYPVYESTSWCTSAQNETVYTYDNLNYYGGFGGWFTPIGYQSGSISLNQFWILNQIFNSDFLAYQSFNSDFLSESMFMIDKSYISPGFTIISWGLVEEAGTNIFPYPPLSTQEYDDLIYSKLKSEILYKEGETSPCKKKEYYYEIQGVTDEATFGIVFNEQFVVPFYNKASPSDGAGLWDLGAAHFFSNVHGSYFQRKSWAKYYYKTGCSAFLDHVIETDFLTGGDVVKTTNFNYTDHYLISNIVEAQSNNSIRKELYKYPFNYTTGIYSTMTNQNMYLYPVESLTTRDDFVISGVISTFKTDDGIIVPDIYYSFASIYPTPVGVCEFDGSVPVENYWNEKVIYDNYNNGNLVQYHLKYDIDISFIWAYNDQYPVISAKNIEQSTLEVSVNNIQSDLESFLADLGDLSTQNSIDSWKSFNIALREDEDLKDAFITTYTYIPLVGITSETDPSGITTYYYYDSFNRLETIKDHNGNIIKHIDYHYKDE